MCESCMCGLEMDYSFLNSNIIEYIIQGRWNQENRGALRVEMDFTRTFQASIYCNNRIRVHYEKNLPKTLDQLIFCKYVYTKF